MSLNILIVDDSLSMRSVIKKVITASGISIRSYMEAKEGFEALDILKNQKIDLVILDYNMPEMDGIELMKLMQKDYNLKNIPVVVTSVEGSKKRVNEFMENGAAAYIKKPFTPEETRDILYQLFGGGMNGESDTHWRDEELDF